MGKGLAASDGLGRPGRAHHRRRRRTGECCPGRAVPAFGLDNKGTTTVGPDPTAAGALEGFGVAPLTPGALTAPNGHGPGRLSHHPGLTVGRGPPRRRAELLRPEGVQITSFAIYPKSGYLTASARVGGKWVGRIPGVQAGPTQPINGKTLSARLGICCRVDAHWAGRRGAGCPLGQGPVGR